MKPDSRQTAVQWHTLPPLEILTRLNSSPAGLSSAEALQRLKDTGPNELQSIKRVSPWRLLLTQFKNILIIILLLATGISTFLGHVTESIAIGVIVLFAVLLGFIQEFRAEKAIEALRRMTAPSATVVRNGENIELPAMELVPGDLVLVTAGNSIPADIRLLEAVNLQIDEAALTGESVPVDKHSAAIAGDDLPLGDRKNMAYSGTAATYGRGRGVVVSTGMSTEFGKIASMLQTVESGRTPLQENLDRVGRMLGRAAFAIVAVIVVLGLFRGQPFTEMLIFGIALAVAVVPEALPAVVTISLALGVQKMVNKNALMRRLSAVETLGSTSVICSDKTGTLTKDEMTVKSIYLSGLFFDVTGSGYDPHGDISCFKDHEDASGVMNQFLKAAALSCDAHIVHVEAEERWHVKGDPTEGALIVMASKGGLNKNELDNCCPRINEIPFSSETKRMTTMHATPDGPLICAKGAPEIILASCIDQLTNSGKTALDDAGRKNILEAAHSMADRALRVLAVACKTDSSIDNAEHGLTFLGLAGMIDPPRPEAAAAIQKCKQAGIKAVMITGDHPVTARAVARELGILKTGRVITGAELDQMDEAALDREVAAIEVYARVSPADKLRVVTALQKKQHVVAMTGDGVNDAPALKKADIGIAMGITGTDVSKEAAAMTLTDDNFASIVAAVEEGRSIFSNIKKYLMYLLSANIGEIGLMASAMLLGLPMPLTAVQILYVNLATDGLPALALAVDPAEADLMKRQPRSPRSGIFNRPVTVLMLMGGCWSTLVNLTVFWWAQQNSQCIEAAMTMSFITLVLIEFFKAYNYRSDRISLFSAPFANKWLNLAIAWELMLLFTIVYLPVLQEPFGTYKLSPGEWLIAFAAAFSVTPVLELGKWMVRQGWFGETS